MSEDVELAQEASESRESKDEGQKFLEAINAAESSDDLRALMLNQAQAEAERINQVGFKNPYSVNADKEAVQAIEEADSREALAEVAKDAGFKVDAYGAGQTADLVSPYEEQIDPEDVGKALAQAKSQADIIDVMRRSGLTVSHG